MLNSRFARPAAIHLLLAGIALLIMSLCCSLSAQEKADVTVEDIKMAWATLRSRIKTMDLTFVAQYFYLNGAPRLELDGYRRVRIVTQYPKAYQHEWGYKPGQEQQWILAYERERAFDGKVKTSLRHQPGSNVVHGQVLPEEMGSLHDDSPADAIFNLGRLCSRDLFLSTPLEIIGNEMVRGHFCYVVRGKRGSPLHNLRIWFAPGLSFLPLRCWLQTAGGATVADMNFLETREVEPGLWFPFKAVSIRPDHGFKAEHTVEEARINDRIPEDFFRVKWPEGTIVSDHIIGATYRIRRKAEIQELEKFLGPDLAKNDMVVSAPVVSEKELEDTLAKALAQEKEAKSQRVSADQSDENEKPVSLRKIWFGWEWLVALAVIVFVIALLVRWHRTRNAHK